MRAGAGRLHEVRAHVVEADVADDDAAVVRGHGVLGQGGRCARRSFQAAHDSDRRGAGPNESRAVWSLGCGRSRRRHELGGRLCLGFVNSVEWRRGAAPVDPGHRVPRPRRAAGPGAARAAPGDRAAGGALSLFSAVGAGSAPDPSDVDVLDRAFRAGSRHLTLGADLRLTWTGADRLGWDVAADAVALLDGPDRARLKQCPGETCGWLFLDGSRNGSRQWCDSRMCGNRARARRHYHRRRGATRRLERGEQPVAERPRPARRRRAARRRTRRGPRASPRAPARSPAPTGRTGWPACPARGCRGPARSVGHQLARHQRGELVRPLVEVHVGVQAARLLQRVLRSPGSGVSRFSGRAGAVKNRYASKWLHRTPRSSTTAAVAAGDRRSGQASWRTSSGRLPVDHRPLVHAEAAEVRPARAAVRVSRSRIHGSDSRAGAAYRRGVEGDPRGGGPVVAAQLLDGSAPVSSTPGARVPAAQLRGPVRVVGEEEVLDRMLGAGAAPRQVRRDPAVDALLVRRPAGPPRRRVQRRRRGLGGGGSHAPRLASRTDTYEPSAVRTLSIAAVSVSLTPSCAPATCSHACRITVR